jgi:hypothetical protein
VRTVRQYLRSLAGLALLAMLAFAGMPTLSFVTAASAGSPLTLVCTAQGMQWVAAHGVAQPGDASPANERSGGEHCPGCLSSQLAADLPSGARLPWRPAPAALVAIGPFVPEPAAPLPWSAAQPRAPPLRG